MTAGPRLPRIRAKTEAERAAEELRVRRQEADSAARARVNSDAADEGKASPYDLLADALYDVTADAVFGAIMSPDFADALRRRGYVVAPVCDTTPGPPEQWMNDGIDLMGAAGVFSEPLERLHDLWDQAFQAGWAAHAATEEGQR